MLWLLASEAHNGEINKSTEEIAFRLRMTEKEVVVAIKPLLHMGFFIDADNVLAECLQDATTETETETEKSRDRVRDRDALLAPEGVSIEIWNDFVLQRKKSRAVISDNVIKSIAKEAQKAGWSLEQALAECAARGWRGFKAEWVKDNKKPDVVNVLTRGLISGNSNVNLLGK
jgi:hypothetical protein